MANIKKPDGHVPPRIMHVANLRNRGLSSAEISEITGRTKSTVEGYIHQGIQLGVVKRHKGWSGKPKHEAVAAVYHRNFDYKDVATEFNVSVSHASNMVKAARLAGIARPSPMMTGETPSLKRMLPNEVKVWVREQTVDGMNDMETIGLMVLDAYDAAHGGEDE